MTGSIVGSGTDHRCVPGTRCGRGGTERTRLGPRGSSRWRAAAADRPCRARLTAPIADAYVPPENEASARTKPRTVNGTPSGV